MKVVSIKVPDELHVRAIARAGKDGFSSYVRGLLEKDLAEKPAAIAQSSSDVSHPGRVYRRTTTPTVPKAKTSTPKAKSSPRTAQPEEEPFSLTPKVIPCRKPANCWCRTCMP